MGQQRPDHETGSPSLSPTGAAAVLLGAYVAMYLAVGAVVHLLGAPDANATSPTHQRIEVAPDSGTPANDEARISVSQSHDDASAD